MKALPHFNDNPFNIKNELLTQEVINRYHEHPIVLHLLELRAYALGKSRQELRVMDYGCGRGDKVAYLRSIGYDCYGVEIEPAYIKNSHDYFGVSATTFPIVSCLQNNRSLFTDGFFDVVVSDQVFEHVRTIDPVVNELARVMNDEAVGLHIFPSAHSIIEPHMFLPIVHWLPKGRLRKLFIHILLALGMGASYFKSYSTAERASIFSYFSDTDTFYRNNDELLDLFRQNGLVTRNVAREKLLYRGGFIAKMIAIPIVGALITALYSTFYQTYLLTAKNNGLLVV